MQCITKEKEHLPLPLLPLLLLLRPQPPVRRRSWQQQPLLAVPKPSSRMVPGATVHMPRSFLAFW